MISAHKYLNLDLSVLNLGGIIISALQQHGALKYDELLEKVILATEEKAKHVFIPALCFLYILGKVEYRQDIDTIEYLK